ncbi:hypothetical protein Lepto7375DRAFT_1780 [Leptolyngbya sp. PCC 7375]|nr:hypothetical protein Lepto7375DRAFT_1780 [Leptolyngbya sp. PCC 7375]
MQARNSNLTAETFSELCEGRFTPSRVTQEMLDVVARIPQVEARKLCQLPETAPDFYLSEYPDMIERSVPGCRSRHMFAILQVAQTWGDDGWDSDSRVSGGY